MESKGDHTHTHMRAHTHARTLYLQIQKTYYLTKELEITIQ